LYEVAESPLPEEIRAKFNDSFAKQFGKRDMLPPGATYADAEVLRLHINTILKGDVASAAFISDRIEGKPPNRLDLIGHERQEITLKVVTAQSPPRRERIEATLFRDVVALIEQSKDGEDELLLTKAAELAQMLKARAQQKGPIDVAPLARIRGFGGR